MPFRSDPARLLSGTAFTASTTNGFIPQRLLPDGSVLGMKSTFYLCSWTPGSAATLLPGQPTDKMFLLEVNDNGDILAASTGSVNGQWRLWLRRGTA